MTVYIRLYACIGYAQLCRTRVSCESKTTQESGISIQRYFLHVAIPPSNRNLSLHWDFLYWHLLQKVKENMLRCWEWQLECIDQPDLLHHLHYPHRLLSCHSCQLQPPFWCLASTLRSSYIFCQIDGTGFSLSLNRHYVLVNSLVSSSIVIQSRLCCSCLYIYWSLSSAHSAAEMSRLQGSTGTVLCPAINCPYRCPFLWLS